MAGGKVHGQGGHGQFSRELGRKYEHQQVAKKKIERAQEKTGRRLERKVEEVKDQIEVRLKPTASRAAELTTMNIKSGKVNQRNGRIRFLAIEEWMKNQVCAELAARKIDLGDINAVREQIHVFPEEEVTKITAELLGEKPDEWSVKSLRAEIHKWAARVPRMAQGHY